MEIKKEKIADIKKLEHVERELTYLKEALDKEKKEVPIRLKIQLLDVNKKIWDTEDILREKISYDRIDDVIKLSIHAALNAKYNDERFLIKNKINKVCNSIFQEQKAHNELYSAD